jgi:hypothetical protein
MLTAKLNAFPLQVFADCFQEHFKRFNKRVQVGGGFE